MAKSSNLYVGMDVHKESIDIALAEGAGRQEVRHYVSIGGDLAALDQAVRKLQATGKTLHFVYEAGPCGQPHDAGPRQRMPPSETGASFLRPPPLPALSAP